LNAGKILCWTSLWMRLMAAAEDPAFAPRSDPLRRLYRAPLCPGPRGDIASLCAHLRIGAEFKARLVQRRNEVVAHSWRREPHDRADRLLAHWATAASAVGETPDEMLAMRPGSATGDGIEV
jgi:hypothetical protein